MATQADVARRAGVDRSTVSKILSGYPDDVFDPKTRAKVEAIASRLGYRLPPRRRIRAPRFPAGLPAQIVVRRCADGAHFASGTGWLMNLSRTGALLTELVLDPPHLPTSPFEIEVLFRFGPGDSPISLKSRALRIQSDRATSLGLGVKFDAPSKPAQQAIEDWIVKNDRPDAKG